MTFNKEPAPTPDPDVPMSSKLLHAFWMGFINFTFYVFLAVILPMWSVLIICIYMGVGEAMLQKSLRMKGTTPSAIAQGFQDFLKFYALKIFWPLTVGLLR